MEERYIRNLGALSEEDIGILRTKKVCVVGCGGIGGYAIEMLARLGIGELTVVDGDSFTVSNLNRQLLSGESLIGENKARAARERVRRINSELPVNVCAAFVSETNANEILGGHDLIIDAVDSIAARRIIAEGCAKQGIFMVHAAISGWSAQVAVIAPNSGAIDRIYTDKSAVGTLSTLAFVPALAASLQAAEAVKILLNKAVTLQSRLLLADLYTQEYVTINI